MVEHVSSQEHDACTTSVVGSDHRLTTELQHREPAGNTTVNDEEQIQLSWSQKSSVERACATIDSESSSFETNLQEHTDQYGQSAMTTTTKHDTTDIKSGQCVLVARCAVVQGGIQLHTDLHQAPP